MSRTTTILLAALEAFVVAAVGVGLAFVPLVLVWAISTELTGDLAASWGAAALAWLVGNGVDLAVSLDPVTAAALGIGAEGASFTVTIALLGFTALTVGAGAHVGRRSAAAGHSVSGILTAALATGAVGGLLAATASIPGLTPSAVQSVAVPALLVVAGGAVGAGIEATRLGARATDATAGRLRAWLAGFDPAWRDAARFSLRAGAAAAVGVVGAGALAVAAALVVDYATVVGLWQSLRADVPGGIVLALGQLALLPNLVAWASSWILGPGFALGAGTSVSPGGTLLGPVPGLPVLGAIPKLDPGLGYLALLVPVLLGFAAGFAVRRSVDARRSRRAAGRPEQRPARRSPAWSWTLLVGEGLAAGVVAGVLLAVLAWWSGGAAGPGRLAEVGPDWWVAGGAAALLTGIPAVLGAVAARVTAPAPHPSPTGPAPAPTGPVPTSPGPSAPPSPRDAETSVIRTTE
ncbi:cell division protein PerM [Agromyces sp. SYSU T00194]|uniref:cell division protein PerM n=1 Tax=Agromyces chitinivorans TaxID=3158560 RepID=UPI0033970477